MTRKQPTPTWSDRAKQRAVVTVAQVTPVAKSAGLAARQGADVVVAWAAPRVKVARVWAAPRVEQAGFAVRDKIAPTVSDALVDAARWLDDPPPKRRRWPWMVAGFAMLAAAGSAAAAIMLRRRPQIESFEAEDQATGEGTAQAPGIDNGSASSVPPPAAEEESVNGRMRTR